MIHLRTVAHWAVVMDAATTVARPRLNATTAQETHAALAA